MEKINENNKEELIEKKKEVILLNKFLENKLSLYKKYVELTKDIMNKFPIDDKDSALKLFNSYIDVINNDYNNLKEEYDKKIDNKYQSLYEESTSDITMGRPILYQYRNEEFYLDYLEKEKEDLITGLKKSVKQSKEFHLFREPKRDILIDIKNGNKEIDKAVNDLQQNMLYECKKCNKFKERKKKYKYQIDEIKKNIKILEKYIKEEKKNIDFDNNIENVKKPSLFAPNKNEKEQVIEEENQNKEKNFIENGMENKIEIENGMENKIEIENGMKKENLKENRKKSPKEFRMENKIENEKEKENGMTNKYFYGKIDFKQSINIALNPNFMKNFQKKKESKGDDNSRRHSSRDKNNKKKHGGKNLKTSIRALNKKNKIISEFEKVEQLFEISIDDEKEGIIDEELHSDDETVFENRIKKKKDLKDYLKDLKKTIPEINLKQIEFNKIKIINEADVFSNQRRNYKNQNIEKNIKDLKKQIEKMKEKLEYIKKKEKIMKEYIEKFKMKAGNIYKRGSGKFQIKSDFVRESLMGKLPNKNTPLEMIPDDEKEYGLVCSDYENEEDEITEPETNKKYTGETRNMKKSVMVGRINFNNKNKKKLLGESIQTGDIKNPLKYQTKKKKKNKIKRAKSK